MVTSAMRSNVAARLVRRLSAELESVLVLVSLPGASHARSRHPQRHRGRRDRADRRTADVAVDGGTISQVGTVEGHGDEEIDAAGMLVMPGIVDVHTHYDGQVTWDPVLRPSSWHGVTTLVMGNCGVGFARRRPTATTGSSA